MLDKLQILDHSPDAMRFEDECIVLEFHGEEFTQLGKENMDEKKGRELLKEIRKMLLKNHMPKDDEIKEKKAKVLGKDKRSRFLLGDAYIVAYQFDDEEIESESFTKKVPFDFWAKVKKGDTVTFKMRFDAEDKKWEFV